MRAVIIVLAALAFEPAGAAVLTWPGSAPCDTSLDACISSAGAGDTVLVASDTVEENVFISNQSFTLAPAPGFAAEFQGTNDLSIRFNDGGNYSVTVRGLQFQNAGIDLSHTAGDGTIRIERNRFAGLANNQAAIYLRSNSDVDGADFDYSVLHNAIESGNAFQAGIRFSGGGTGNRSQLGVIEGNVIALQGDDAGGITVRRDEGTGLFQTRIFGNTVENATREGISIINASDAGGLSAYLYSNLIYSRDIVERSGSGIRIYAFSSSVSTIVANNSLIGNVFGLQLLTSAGETLSATVKNNLTARNQIAWNLGDGTSITEAYNLFHANDSEPSPIDGTSIKADPLLHPNLPGRLKAGSPAIDAGDNAATSTFPGVDAVGNGRFINATTDIGAVEYGNHWLLARKSTTTNNNFAVDSDVLNNQPGLYPHVSSVWNPYTQTGVYNNANEGIYYSSGMWRIFNEGGLGDTIAQDASFYLFVPGPNILNTNHTNTSIATSTAVNAGITNNQPGRILAVTQHYNRFGSGVYNDHPIGVFYASGNWRISNLDLVDIPVGADFNVYAQPESYNAYEHIASGANINGHITLLNHPLLDANPCARLKITQSASQGVFNAHPVGVYYTGNQWAVFNQDFATMPENAAFHIIIDPDSATCELFSDRFQEGRF